MNGERWLRRMAPGHLESHRNGDDIGARGRLFRLSTTAKYSSRPDLTAEAHTPTNEAASIQSFGTGVSRCRI